MAISVILLTSGASTTNGTQFVTESVAPNLTSRVMIFVGGTDISTNTFTISGLGATWTSHGHYANGTAKGALFSCLPSNTGTITITASGTVSGCTWQVLEGLGNGAGPPDAINVSTNQGLNTTLSVTLGSPRSASSRPVAGYFLVPEAGEVGFSSLLAAGSSTDGTSFTTPSISPTPYGLLVLGVTHARGGGATSVSTVTGNGLTWTMRKTLSLSASTAVEVWTAPCGASPTTEGITITTAAIAESVTWDVIQAEGQDPTAPLILTNQPTATGNSTQPHVVFDSPASLEGGFVFVCGAAGNVTQTPKSGWTEIGDAVTTVPSTAIAAQWRKPFYKTNFVTRMKPTNVTQNQMDTSIANAWATFKTNFLKQNVTQGWYGIDFEPTAGTSEVHYVPEGQGYGLLLCAYLDSIDASAQTYFNGILKFALDKASSIESRFMGGTYDGNWALVGANDSATDGDMDIALACILAHMRWGTTATVNGQPYKHWADERIAGLKASGFSGQHSLLRLGDWSSGTWERTSRPSDWMIGHFEQFYLWTGDSFWQTAITNHMDATEDLVTDFASSTGLIPDFATGLTRTGLSPGPANVLESPQDDDYYYNSCRIPLRMAAAENTRAIARATALSNWARLKCSGTASNLPTGYTLAGATISGGNYQDNSFIAPFMASAAVDSNQSWLNSCWTYVSGDSASGTYFGDALGLLSMIQVSQTYWLRLTGDLAASTLSGAVGWGGIGLEVKQLDLVNSSSPRTAWTELTEVNHGTPWNALQTQWRSDQFETTSSVDAVQGFDILGIAVELAEQVTETNANAEVATSTGSAVNPSVFTVGEMTVHPPVITVTSAAQNPGGNASGSGIQAAATGSAQNATISVSSSGSVTPTVASASGAAHNATSSAGEAPGAKAWNADVLLSLAPGAITVTSASINATSTVRVNAIVASATGSVSNGKVNKFDSRDASASSTANNPGPSVQVRPTNA